MANDLIGNTLGVDLLNDDAETVLNAAGSYVENLVFDLCGTCPPAASIQILLNGLAKDGQLTPNFDLSGYPAFTPKLQETLNASPPMWLSVENGNELGVRFANKRDACTLSLRFPDDASYAWSDIVGFNHLSIAGTDPNNDYTFLITASVQTSDGIEKVVLEGTSSCFQVKNCDLSGCDPFSRNNELPECSLFTVQPQNLNLTLEPGQDVVRNLIISNAPEHAHPFEYALAVCPPKDWVRLDASSGTLSPGNTRTVPITITGPFRTGTFCTSVFINVTSPKCQSIVEVPICVTVTETNVWELALSREITDLPQVTAEDVLYGEWECPELLKNGTFEAGNVGFQSDLTFSLFDKLTVPQYGIRTSASSAANSISGTDHTTGSSYFLIARGDGLKNVIWSQSIDVTSNTDYTFSYWFTTFDQRFPMPGTGILNTTINGVNVLPNQTLKDATPPSKKPTPGTQSLPMPDITRSQIGQPGASQVSIKKSGNWTQVIVAWNAGTNTTADLKIVKTIGSNFYIGLDDISFKANMCRSVFCDPPLSMELEYENSCAEHLKNIATQNAKTAYETYIDSVKTAFQEAYLDSCMQALETFTVQYDEREYHHTLFYYDRSDTLVKTIPPKGVKVISDPTVLQSVKDHRNNLTTNSPVFPAYELTSIYRRNSLNQVTAQQTPDGGRTEFWHDRLGRLIASQNAEQRTTGRFSYTLFDPIGRIIEVGEINPPAPMNKTIATDDTQFQNWINAGTRTQITRTQYDTPLNPNIAAFDPDGQQNLRSRIASVTYWDQNTDYNSATHYDYDVLGHVETLVQENRDLADIGHDFTLIDYNFDLASGNVNEVHYQPGKPDRFRRRYEYDADNRIDNVFTSPDGVIWDNDATYGYYLHGPLARTRLGDLGVQGIDYAYTIQGWLKGVNSNTLYPERDIGRDGHIVSGNLNSLIARDAVGFTLGYFNDDYQPIDPSVAFEAQVSGASFNNASPDLWNGNIRHMVTAIAPFMQNDASPQGTAYRYDQLNRLMSMLAFQNLVRADNAWGSGTHINDYATSIGYDANGNILELVRNGSTSAGPIEMDQLHYHYNSDNNQLTYIHDPVPDTNYDIDIDDQTEGNYKYDAIGNLIEDLSEGIRRIDWTVYGKVRSVYKTNTKDIHFRYGPNGNRIAKILTDSSRYYVRDADGNTLATYIRKGNDLRLESHLLYGSQRLGEYRADTLLTGANTLSNTFTRTRGKYRYELGNHLDNVLAVITDRKIPYDDLNSNGITDYYTTDVLAATDSYAFGMSMPGRENSQQDYRYGYNGMEKDDEIKGKGSAYDFGEREYDPRLCRWWSVDVFSFNAPNWSPYRFAFDNPLFFIDKNGTFEISKALQSKYPNLKPALDNIATELKNNKSKMAIIMKLGEFKSSDQVLALFSNDAIRIEAADLLSLNPSGTLTGDNAQTTMLPREDKVDGMIKGVIAIDENLMRLLEEKVSGKLSKNAASFLDEFFESTVIHEIVHFGDNQDIENFSDPWDPGKHSSQPSEFVVDPTTNSIMEKREKEIGTYAEKEIYGRDVKAEQNKEIEANIIKKEKGP